MMTSYLLQCYTAHRPDFKSPTEPLPPSFHSIPPMHGPSQRRRRVPFFEQRRSLFKKRDTSPTTLSRDTSQSCAFPPPTGTAGALPAAAPCRQRRRAFHPSDRRTKYSNTYPTRGLTNSRNRGLSILYIDRGLWLGTRSIYFEVDRV